MNGAVHDGRAIIIPVGTSLRDAERLIIEATLRHTEGNVSQAARVLGIDRGTLHKKIKEYQVPFP